MSSLEWLILSALLTFSHPFGLAARRRSRPLLLRGQISPLEQDQCQGHKRDRDRRQHTCIRDADAIAERIAAHLMIITLWLHMFRVVLTGSYRRPREFNWCVGVILLVLTLLLSFTGYLLPDDQLGFWAVTVGTNMARATPLL